MHFTTDQQDDITTFRLREPRLDSRNAGQLKAEFLILAQPDIRALIVDLHEVEHVDSAGLSALLLAQRQMNIHHGELRLAGAGAQIRSLLEMTQLERVFRLFDTVEEAQAAPVLQSAWEPNGWQEEPDLEFAGTGASAGVYSGAYSGAYAGVFAEASLGPEAPSSRAIRTGAIAAGGSIGAAALAEIMMSDDLLDSSNFLSALGLDALGAAALGDAALGDEEEDDDDDDVDEIEETFDDEDDYDEEDDDDELKEEDDLDEEDDVEEEVVKEEDVVEPEDLDEFEDDDWDEEELDDDDEEDY